MLGANTLAEETMDPIRFVCPRCKRSGRYSKATLLAEFGPDISMPELRLKVATWRGCPHVKDNPYDPAFLAGDKCEIHYVLEDVLAAEKRKRGGS